MDYREDLLELKKIKNQIWRTNSKEKRLALVNSYCYLASYLGTLEVADDDKLFEELNVDKERFLTFLNKGKMNYNIEYIKNIDIITELINKLLIFYHDTPIIQSNGESNKKANFQNGIKKMLELYKGLDESIYKVYHDLIMSNNISLMPTFQDEGAAFNSTFTGSPRVIAENRANAYETLSTISHELGHCYEFIRNRTNPCSWTHYNLCEVSSLFLQKIFDHHMMEDYEFGEVASIENVYNYICLQQQTLMADVANKLLTNNSKLCGISPEGIEIDESVADSLISDDLIKAYYNFGISFSNYLYVLSDIIASYMYKIYKQNPNEAISLFNHFITTRDIYSFRELLKMYASDLSGVRDEISEASAYQKKLFYL